MTGCPLREPWTGQAHPSGQVLAQDLRILSEHVSSATVIVQYVGRPIIRATLLEYSISYRNHQAFHEATVEQIFVDIQTQCQPEVLSVTGRFLRRGGIDINPFRSNVDDQATALRLPRQ